MLSMLASDANIRFIDSKAWLPSALSSHYGMQKGCPCSTLLVPHADPLLTLVRWPSKTECRPFEGPLGHIPRQSSPREASQSLSDSLTGSFASVSTNPTARRYSSRTKSRPDAWVQSASPTSADVERGESRRLRSGRNTLYKSSGITSPRTSTSPPTATVELDTVEKDTAGFLPKLGKILEGKEHNQQRCQKSSPASLREIQTPPYRNRVAEDASIVPCRTARQRHSSSQQRASLANFSNPSLLSVQSDFTISSNTSSGSNSTVTQQSYERSNMAKKKQAKERRRRIEIKRASAKSNVMDALPDTPGVFQYMNESLAPAQSHSGGGGRPGSSSSSSSSTSSSSDVRRDETSSSHDDEPIVESPMTSPPSTGRSLDKTLEPHERLKYDSGISAQGGSPKSNGHTHSRNQPSVHDSEEEEEKEEGEEEEEEEEEAEEEAEEERDDGEEGNSEDDDDEDEDQDASRNYTSEKAVPPVLPSDSTSHRKKDVEHDRHHQRLKDREKELREHVLQSPQPQRDFHFFGGPSPTPQPAIPFLDPHSQYGASANLYPQTPPEPGWRPTAPAPPPGDFYSPPQVPHMPLHTAADDIYAMTARSIPGPPNTLAPPPPFQYPQVQPPQYLARPVGPDFSKTTVIGYELLADKLSECPKENVIGEDKVIPMYRKFEQLNHRILLHLQDEISELEEELRYLDEYIAQMSPVSNEGRPQPASRRAESRQGGDLHWRRTSLLGRIYLKLGQYSERKAFL